MRLFARKYSSILLAFARFAAWRLLPMLLTWPTWSLHIRKQRGQLKRERGKRGNPRRNPTALR